MSAEPAGVDHGAGADFRSYALDVSQAILGEQHKYSTLPLDPEDILSSEPNEAKTEVPPPIATHVTVLRLDSDADWTNLHSRIAGRKNGNTSPWFRCLGVLRGLNAKSVVIEPYYVCLDYRSEFASFYAHLDAPRRSFTIRLHFFDQYIEEDDVTSLPKQIPSSYLGYIVCREGDLPLVGRAVIRTPTYVTNSTEIRESVNFFGQKLTVDGVPFMQQDARLTACAHIAVWIAHYSAFRRGLLERRLIAEFVTMSGSVTPMRPRLSDGLTFIEVARLFDQVGMRTIVFAPANGDGPELPGISRAELPSLPNPIYKFEEPEMENGSDADSSDDLTENKLDRLSESEDLGALLDFGLGDSDGDTLTKFFANCTPAIEASYMDYRDYLDDEGDSKSPSPAHPAVTQFETVLKYLIQPYVDSKWPVYAGSEDHAFAVIGYSSNQESPLFFLHDDQNGPYLATSSLLVLSEDTLKFQSGRFRDIDSHVELDSPPSDRVLGHLQEQTSFPPGSVNRGVDTLIVPVAQRVMLPAHAANRAALQWMAVHFGSDAMANEPRARPEGALLQDLTSMDTRVSILMGIDYKVQRRTYAFEKHDQLAIHGYSALQLAEWVVVVEGISSDKETSGWEVVFDASSSSTAPRFQFVRILDAMSVLNPLHPERPEGSPIVLARFPLISIAWKLSKFIGGDAGDAINE